MEDEKITKTLYELRNEIEVNTDLKKQLRKTFVKKSRKRKWKNAWIPLLTAAILFLAFLLSNEQMPHVKASSLKIANSISFLDIGSGEITAYTYHDGRLYLSLEGRGIFVYENEFKQVLNDAPNSFSRSSKEEKLLFTNNGDVFLFDVKTTKSEKLLDGTSDSSYIYPEWKDQNHIYLTKVTDKEKQIVEVNMQTKEESIIASGEMASFVEKEQKLVFERHGEIIIYNVKSGKETIVDRGKNPSVTNDGNYISYVKERSGFEDVWITDMDLETKNKVTTNPPPRYEPSVKGMYRYQLPIWGNDERTLYVMKNRNDGENEPAKIMKIELSEQSSTEIETVKSYLQALIVRDDDFAKSLLKDPPEFLTYSNPKQIGFHILETTNNEQSTSVKAEVYWTDIALAYYKVSTYELTLMKENERYVIETVKELNTTELLANEQNEIEMVKDGKGEALFSLQDIPQSLIQAEDIRFSSLLNTHDEKNVIFSLQGMDETSGVTLFSFNRETKSFNLLATLKGGIMEKVALDATGRYLTADYLTDAFDSKLFIFDLEKGKQTDFTNVRSVFWKEDKLILEEVAETHSMYYQYDPHTGSKKNY
ncbi:TolB family protein [Lysinibacillus sp. NPDC096418]|uniref:TolB family protein n=1 Tax=Lysinibacillus sp. NPDC096418 TaxID=3364138 RepID=UPI0038216E07